MFEHDFIRRLIQQMAAVMARAMTLGKGGKYDHALEELETAWDLIGVPAQLVDRLDAPTLAGLLPEPERRQAAVDVLTAEATLREQQAPGTGAARQALADELRATVGTV